MSNKPSIIITTEKTITIFENISNYLNVKQSYTSDERTAIRASFHAELNEINEDESEKELVLV